jgi:branched-chain amino acid aminotransferase
MAKYCYFNGKFCTEDKVRISPYDIGILRGYGVFDVMTTANGKPFLVKEHYARLKKSATLLGLKLPFTAETFKSNVEKLLTLNKKKMASIRTVVTGGVSPDSFSVGVPTCYILIEDFHCFPAEAYEKGIRLMTLNHVLTVPQAKVTINYIEAIKNQKQKKKANASEILYVKEDNVLECSTSNIFIVKGDTIITPKERMLYGTTRNFVIKLIKKKYTLEERDITYRELQKADEAFITATNKHVVPVVQVDAWKIGKGRVGEKTREIMKMFHDYRNMY